MLVASLRRKGGRSAFRDSVHTGNHWWFAVAVVEFLLMERKRDVPHYCCNINQRKETVLKVKFQKLSKFVFHC